MIVLMMLIAVSMAITVIAQPLRNRFGPTTSSTSTSTSTSTTATATTAARPKEIARASKKTVESANRQTVSVFRAGSPNRIEIALGGRLTLLVRAKAPQQVLIPGLGLASFADPYAPARFDILARERGSFEVRGSRDGNLGVVVVVKRVPPQSP